MVEEFEVGVASARDRMASVRHAVLLRQIVTVHAFRLRIDISSLHLWVTNYSWRDQLGELSDIVARLSEPIAFKCERLHQIYNTPARAC